MSNPPDSENCIGKVTAVETKFTWCIDDTSKLSKLSAITSPVFKMTIDNVNTKWILCLYEKDEESDNDDDDDDDDDDDEYLGLYLKSLNSGKIKATVNFYNLNVYNDRELNRRTLENQEFEPEDCWGFPKFIERKRCTLVCSITTSQFIRVETRKDELRADDELKLAEFHKLEKLFNKKKFSDVVFEVEAKEIHVHKCLVANRSPVFEAMFTHDTSEAQKNRVEISDISYLAMRDMLRYMYTGRLPEYVVSKAEKSLMDLLVAAEKYCIGKLKRECEKKLSIFLEVDNVFEYLNFSDTHNASNLKEKVMEFMVEHGKEIVALPNFKKHCGELHADVVSVVFRALVIKKRKVE